MCTPVYTRERESDDVVRIHMRNIDNRKHSCLKCYSRQSAMFSVAATGKIVTIAICIGACFWYVCICVEIFMFFSFQCNMRLLARIHTFNRFSKKKKKLLQNVLQYREDVLRYVNTILCPAFVCGTFHLVFGQSSVTDRLSSSYIAQLDFQSSVFRLAHNPFSFSVQFLACM